MKRRSTVFSSTRRRSRCRSSCAARGSWAADGSPQTSGSSICSADGARSAGRRRSTRLSALGQQPRRRAPRRDRPDARQPAVCRVAGAAAAFRMERPASAPARIVEVRAGPEARALRSRGGSARAAQPRRRSSRREPRRFEATLAKMLDQERRVGTTATAETAAGRSARTARRPRLRQRRRPRRPTSGADPKDKILEFRQRQRRHARAGILALNRREYAAAARAFEALIGRGIESFEAHLYLARSLAGHEARRSRRRRISSRRRGARRCSKRRGRAGPKRVSRRRTGGRAGDRSRGPETESAAARSSRCSTRTCAFGCADPTKRSPPSKPPPAAAQGCLDPPAARRAAARSRADRRGARQPS